MRRKYIFLIVILAALLLAGGLALRSRARTSRALDRLIAALPPRTPPPSGLVPLRPEARKTLASTRLIELLREAREYGTGGNFGEISLEMAQRDAILTELQERLAAGALSEADQRLFGEELRTDLAADRQWSESLRSLRLAWLRWFETLRRGEVQDESEVLGPPREFQKALGFRRIKDGDILEGWRAVERFYARIGEILPTREDYGAALDALVEWPTDPDAAPVAAYFAKYATRDLKASGRRLREFRLREEQLLRSVGD
jgi:hypothetical protein